MVDLGTHPSESGKERAERLRREAREAAGAPRVKEVTVVQRQDAMPKGLRFDFSVDSRAAAWGLTITPDSKEAATAFLNYMRWACNQVGVDFVIIDYDTKKKAPPPTRIV
jgi:hypothetical protein